MVKSNRLFLNNFSIYFLGLISSGLISFITIPLIVRYYGVEAYGSFSLVQNIILVLISFGGGWLNQCILRFNDYSSSFKITIFQLYFIVFLPLSFICFSILAFMGIGIFLSVIATITMFFGSVSAISVTFYQSKFNARKSFYFDFVRIIVFLLMILSFYYFFSKLGSLWRLMLSFFISYFISFLFLLKIDFKFLQISFKLFLNRFNKNYFISYFKENNHLLQYGWPLALWFTISSLLNVSDRYIIGYYLTDKDLGTYSAIYDLLYKGITMLYAPILISGYPIMSKKYNEGLKKEAYQFLKKLILLEVGIFLIVLIVGFIFRSFFIEHIVGLPKTNATLGLVLPIMIGAFVWQLGMLMHKPLEFQLKTKKMLLFVSISLVINIILNMVFIPIYGVIFAAYSTLVSALIYLILNLIVLNIKR